MPTVTPMKKKAKSSQAAREQGSKKRKASEMTVADRLEHDELGDVSLDAKKRSRSDKETMYNLIKDNFLDHGFTMEEVALACVDGVYLTDELERDKALNGVGLCPITQYVQESRFTVHSLAGDDGR